MNINGIMETLGREDAKQAVDELVIKCEDSWSCIKCGKMSILNSNMKMHAEIHIDGLSFKCSIYNTHFKTRNRLKIHKTRKHK